MSILFPLPENIQLGFDAIFWSRFFSTLKQIRFFIANNSRFSFKKGGGWWISTQTLMKIEISFFVVETNSVMQKV